MDGATFNSRYRGVSWNKISLKWVARIKHEGKQSHLGYFDDEESAARKYDESAAGLGRPLNFPLDGGPAPEPGRWGFLGFICPPPWQKFCRLVLIRNHCGSSLVFAGSLKRRKIIAEKIKKDPSAFKGVSWHFGNQMWKSQIKINGKCYTLGYFEDEETAARKYDEQAITVSREPNFPAGGDAGKGAETAAKKPVPAKDQVLPPEPKKFGKGISAPKPAPSGALGVEFVPCPGSSGRGTKRAAVNDDNVVAI